jgi:hypothetical protein
LCDLTGHTDKRIRKRQSLFLYEIKRDLKDPFYFDSFNFDLTGQNTKKQAKPLFPVGESRSFFFSAMQKRRILIGKAYPEEKKRISKPFVKKASSVSK